MKSLKWIFCIGIFFGQRAGLDARSLVVDNFDDVNSGRFSYKDDKGTNLSMDVGAAEERGKVLSLKYSVVKDGWAGMGFVLKRLNVREHTQLTFWIRSEDSNLNFDIGLKDTVGIEKKVPILDYVDIAKEWRKVVIPLKDFKGVTMGSLDNLSITFYDSSGKGKILIDDIQFEAPAAEVQESGVIGTSSNKVIVDSFERANPTDMYLVYEGDDSSLRLNASRVAREGDYSMELEYQLSTSRSWGSWVSAQWQSKQSQLDWRGAQDVKLWVKGDGSGNVIRFIIKDADGEIWTFDDTEILKAANWQLLSMPVTKFRLESPTFQKNGKMDLDQVHAYAVMLLGSGGSATTSGTKNTVGRIQIDSLYVTGEGISMVWAVPPKVLEDEKVRILRIGNIDLNGQVLTEFLNAPEQKSTVNHLGKLIANGKIGDYSAKIELTSQSQEFGDAASYSINESTIGGSVAKTRYPGVEVANIGLTANNISPYLTQVTIGSLFIDYSPYTFSPVYGFKGLNAEGDWNLLNYNFFVLKHKYDSFTIGTRLKLFWEGFRMTGISVYYRETARVENAGKITDSTLKSTNDLTLQEVQDDWVYTMDVERLFWDDKIMAGGTMGYNRYNQNASADRSDPFDPKFSQMLDTPLKVDGYMFRGRTGLSNVLIPGLRLNYEYRSVETEFKPRYRQNPTTFDDIESDQRGHNARLVQNWRGLTAAVEYDTLERFSNTGFFRRKVKWDLGYYGFERMDAAISQEVRYGRYQFVSNRTGESLNINERVTASEIYIRAQLTPRLAMFLIPRREDVMHMDTGLMFSNEMLFGKLEFFATSNLKMLGEFRTTHYGIKAFEAQGFPYTDNFVRIKVEFNF